MWWNWKWQMAARWRLNMRRYFNTEGQCEPEIHYMVRLDDRLDKIKRLFIDRGKYFIINRGRQYGKTVHWKTTWKKTILSSRWIFRVSAQRNMRMNLHLRKRLWECLQNHWNYTNCSSYILIFDRQQLKSSSTFYMISWHVYILNKSKKNYQRLHSFITAEI